MCAERREGRTDDGCGRGGGRRVATATTGPQTAALARGLAAVPLCWPVSLAVSAIVLRCGWHGSASKRGLGGCMLTGSVSVHVAVRVDRHPLASALRLSRLPLRSRCCRCIFVFVDSCHCFLQCCLILASECLQMRAYSRTLLWGMAIVAVLALAAAAPAAAGHTTAARTGSRSDGRSSRAPANHITAAHSSGRICACA